MQDHICLTLMMMTMMMEIKEKKFTEKMKLQTNHIRV